MVCNWLIVLDGSVLIWKQKQVSYARNDMIPITQMNAFTNDVHAYRNPNHWTEPEVFNPDRFETKGESLCFFPFGEGPMKCIGFKMAMIEVKVLVAKLVLAFDMHLDDKKCVPVTTVTHGLKNGLMVRLQNCKKP
jgi:hypothetical protein